MKLLTINQIKFALATAVLTIIFLVMRAQFVKTGSEHGVWPAAAIFFCAMFYAGWRFGKKDAANLPLAIASLRFHLLTFVVYNAIMLVGALISLHKIYTGTWIMIGLWSIGLGIHALLFWKASTNRINGIRK